jgi:predicted AAA+ superfamily ATPase
LLFPPSHFTASAAEICQVSHYGVQSSSKNQIKRIHICFFAELKITMSSRYGLEVSVEACIEDALLSLLHFMQTRSVVSKNELDRQHVVLFVWGPKF